MKKVISILLAALMVFSLTVTAFADKEAPTTEHTYKAYQIFSGTQSEDGAELGNIEWGDGIDGDALLTKLVKIDAYKDCKSAADVAEVLSKYSDGSAEAKAFAKLANDFIDNNKGIAVKQGDELDAGYYLVVDTTTGDVDQYNLALLQLTNKGEFDINTKVEVPEVEKSLYNNVPADPDHIDLDDHDVSSDSNEVAIGDTVKFAVKSKVPASAADYDYYYFIMNDTMSDGLTYTDGSVKVTINGVPATEGTDYTVKISGQTIQIALVDAVSNAGKTVEYAYEAVLNEKAVVGSTGNTNEATIKYSNNPNEKYDGTQDDDNPGFPDDEKNPPIGETPKDITVTYTTGIKIHKVDENGNPLHGAEFTLEGSYFNLVLIGKEVFEADENGEYWKLSNGTYTKEAPVTEDYMKAAGEGATKGYVVDNGYTGEDKVVIGETTYRPYKPAEDAGSAVYVLVHANADSYDSTETMYSCKTVFEPVKSESGFRPNEPEEEGGFTFDSVTTYSTITAYVDENGEVVFAGIPAGEYTLSETVTPAGYNTIPAINFAINCELPDEIVTGEEKCKWIVTTSSPVTYNDAEGMFEVTVVNQKGNTLPETGGIGTTIFYALGGILVLAAGVLLITKKRMSAEG